MILYPALAAPAIAATPFLVCHYNQEVGCCTRICLLFCNSAYVKKDENKIKTQLLIVCSHSLATDFFSSSPWTQTSSRETGGNFSNACLHCGQLWWREFSEGNYWENCLWPHEGRRGGWKTWMILEITCYKRHSRPFAQATPSGMTDSSPGFEKKINGLELILMILGWLCSPKKRQIETI